MFLNSCSSIPIIHSTRECQRYIDDDIWRPTDVEDITAQILWPKRPILSEDRFRQLSIDQLLDRYRNIICHYDTQNWQDMLNLSVDNSANCKQTFQSFVKQRVESSRDDKASKSALLSNTDDIIGRFRRIERSDGGKRPSLLSRSHVSLLIDRFVPSFRILSHSKSLLSL